MDVKAIVMPPQSRSPESLVQALVDSLGEALQVRGFDPRCLLGGQ